MFICKMDIVVAPCFLWVSVRVGFKSLFNYHYHVLINVCRVPGGPKCSRFAASITSGVRYFLCSLRDLVISILSLFSVCRDLLS